MNDERRTERTGLRFRPRHLDCGDETSIPCTSCPRSARYSAFSPVPQPTSRTSPLIAPASARSMNSRCGRPISHGGVPLYASSKSASRELSDGVMQICLCSHGMNQYRTGKHLQPLRVAHADFRPSSIAIPCPNPTLIVTRPRSASRRFISWTSVTAKRAPQAPSA